MSETKPISFEEFGASFKNFLEHVSALSPVEAPPFLRCLQSHFNAEPSEMPIFTEEFGVSDWPNVQWVIDNYLSEGDRTVQLLGVTGDSSSSYTGVSMTRLLGRARGGDSSLVQGPVQYVNVMLAEDQAIACVQCGLYLITQGGQKMAVFVQGPSEMGRSALMSCPGNQPRRSYSYAIYALQCANTMFIAARFCLSKPTVTIRCGFGFTTCRTSIPSRSFCRQACSIASNARPSVSPCIGKSCLPRTPLETGHSLAWLARNRKDPHSDVFGQPDAGSHCPALDWPRFGDDRGILRHGASATASDGRPGRRRSRC